MWTCTHSQIIACHLSFEITLFWEIIPFFICSPLLGKIVIRIIITFVILVFTTTLHAKVNIFLERQICTQQLNLHSLLCSTFFLITCSSMLCYGFKSAALIQLNMSNFASLSLINNSEHNFLKLFFNGF